MEKPEDFLLFLEKEGMIRHTVKDGVEGFELTEYGKALRDFFNQFDRVE